MPRVLVVANECCGEAPTGALVTLDERVISEHLADSHAALQLLQRVVWAVFDAEAPGAGGSSRP